MPTRELAPPWTPPPPELLLALKKARQVAKWVALLNHKKPAIRDRARREVLNTFLWTLEQRKA
jgi:hypothetical protein